MSIKPLGNHGKTSWEVLKNDKDHPPVSWPGAPRNIGLVMVGSRWLFADDLRWSCKKICLRILDNSSHSIHSISSKSILGCIPLKCFRYIFIYLIIYIWDMSIYIGGYINSWPIGMHGAPLLQELLLCTIQQWGLPKMDHGFLDVSIHKHSPILDDWGYQFNLVGGAITILKMMEFVNGFRMTSIYEMEHTIHVPTTNQ